MKWFNGITGGSLSLPHHIRFYDTRYFMFSPTLVFFDSMACGRVFVLGFILTHEIASAFLHSGGLFEKEGALCMKLWQVADVRFGLLKVRG